MRSKWSAAFLAAMNAPKPENDPVDTSGYYCVRHRDEFLAALHVAKEDGSLETWSMSQVLGIIPPPCK